MRSKRNVLGNLTILLVLWFGISAGAFAQIDLQQPRSLKVITQQIEQLDINYEYQHNKLKQLAAGYIDLTQDIDQQLFDTELSISRTRLSKDNIKILIEKNKDDLMTVQQAMIQLEVNQAKQSEQYRLRLQEYQQLSLYAEKLSRNLATLNQVLSEEANHKAALEQFKTAKLSETHYQERLKAIEAIQAEAVKWRDKLTTLQAQSPQPDNYADELEMIQLEEQLQFLNQKINYLNIHNQFYLTSLESIQLKQNIRMLSQLSEQLLQLERRLNTVAQLITSKRSVIGQFNDFLTNKLTGEGANEENWQDYQSFMQALAKQYQDLAPEVATLNQQIRDYRQKMAGIQSSLRYRLEMPTTIAALTDLMKGLTTLPALFVERLSHEWESAKNTLTLASHWKLFILILLEAATCYACFLLYRFLVKVREEGITQESRFSAKALFYSAESLVRNSVNIIVFTLILCIFWSYALFGATLKMILMLGFVWLVFKIILSMSRLILMENTDSNEGRDVKLYRALRAIFIFGGVLTGITLAAHQLILPAAVLGFLDRIYMMVLLVTCYPLLKHGDVITQVLTSNLTERAYLRKIVRLIVILVPLTIFSNAVVGLFGYINLAWYIGFLEAKIILVISTLLLMRGFLDDLMIYLSEYSIRKVANGWLWTQAILKPLQRVLNILLTLITVLYIFSLFGLTRSPVVEKFFTFIHVPLVAYGKTQITPFNIILFVVMYAIVHWTVKWTREFSYRWLYNGVKDSEVRNSLALFTQYGMVIIGSIVILKALGIDLTTLGYLATGFFVGVAFGVRDIVSNIVSGLLLLIERPVRKGDQVRVNDQDGTVMHIGLRSMVIQTGDNVELILPNNETMVKPFINWTRSDSIIRNTFEIRIALHDNPEWVQQIIAENIVKHQRVLESPKPYVLLTKMGESYLLFTCYYHVDLKKVEKRIEVNSEVMILVLAALKKAGIKIPYPHHAIQIEKQAKH